MGEIEHQCHMDALYRYAMVLTRSPAMAEDLVQETYLRALKAKNGLQENSNIRAWLLTILRNIWISHIRYVNSRPLFSDFEGEGVVNELADQKADPHATYEGSVESERICAAIQRLPSELREIILLRAFEELSYREIADVLKCPTGTVMSRLSRARSALRDLLQVHEKSTSRRECSSAVPIGECP